jgi:hypothetical protein
MLDFPFAVNKTAVFALLTGFSVPLFGGLEHLTHRTLEQTIGLSWTSTIDLAAAMVLFTITKWGHDRADQWVGHWLFRSRASRLAELRRVARDVSQIDSFPELGEGIVASIDRQVGAEGTAAYFVRSGGNLKLQFGTIANAPTTLSSKGDPALLRLQTSGGHVDVLEMTTQVPGDYAFGMRAGSRLVGLVALKLRPHHEDIAPDELAAIQAIADSAASVIDAIRIGELERRLLRRGES